MKQVKVRMCFLRNKRNYSRKKSNDKLKKLLTLKKRKIYKLDHKLAQNKNYSLQELTANVQLYSTLSMVH
jgi:hypothetical protein